MRKIVAIMMTAVLAVGLMPQLAFAAGGDYTAGSVVSQTAKAVSGARKAVSPQAQKKTMWLISKAGDASLSYKNGLLIKVKIPGGYYKYAYKGKRIVSYRNSIMNGWHYNDGKFTYDKKGRLTHVVSGGTQGAMTYQERYTYNSKGRVSKMVHDRTGDKTTYKYTYNKKGKLIKRSMSSNMSYSGSGRDSYSYDGKGNLTRIKHIYSGGSYISMSCKNTYKNGRLVKRSGESYSTSRTMIFKYKKVSVPKKYVAQVKKQQWAILNHDSSVGVLPVSPFYY